jgi:hypothetical protein
MVYPFPNKSLFRLQGAISKGDPYTEKELSTVKDEKLLVLLKQCWKLDPKERPTIVEVVKQLEEIGGYDKDPGPAVITPSATPSI